MPTARKITGREIKVTRQDIRWGTAGSVSYCPIARAAQRQLRTEDVKVYGDMIKVLGDKYALSKRTDNFVFRFDHNLPVKPLKLRIGKKL